MTSSCMLLKLSNELLFQIIDLVHPSSHFDFASTCRQIAACSSDVLQRHQMAYAKYRVASDLDPSTTPTLLRSAVGRDDPIPAWHVRSLEIWRDRMGWADWKVYDFQTPLANDTKGKGIRWEFQGSEIADCLDAYRDALNEFEDEQALYQAERGQDGVLKMLLVANCPRIRELKFVTQARGRENCLVWLKTLISQCFRARNSTNYKPEKAWPPGLASLRDVAVGLHSDTWMDDASEEPSTHILMNLLRLPNISSIYYKDVFADYLDDDDYASRYLPAGFSSVEHLFLDDCGGGALPGGFIETLATSPRALLTAAFRSGEARLEHADDFVQNFARYQGDSLKSLLFYDYGRDPFSTIHGYRCTAYQPDELDDFSKLAQLSISIQDIELYCLGAQHWDEGAKDDPGSHYVNHASTCLPRSMECLVLWDKPGSGFAGDAKGESKLIERAVVKMIEGGEYPDLKSVYIEEIEHHNSTFSKKTALSFQDAVAVGKREGVDVHTLTNRNVMLHGIKFPEAPDKYSLESGPYQGRRPSDWVFNPYLGKRVPPGCGKCGKCEICLTYYSKELWGTLET